MVSFILLLFRGVSTKKLFKLFMDGGERKKSFSECLSLLILSLEPYIEPYVSQYATYNKVLGWVLKDALLFDLF